MSKLSVFISDFQKPFFKTIRFHEGRQVSTIMHLAEISRDGREKPIVVTGDLPTRRGRAFRDGLSTPLRPIGFIGLGLMGEPMALNLVRAGTPLVVWDRSSVKSDLLAKAGARVAKDPQDVFRECEAIMLMLRDGAATDIALGRQDPSFRSRVNGHTIINMATTSPRYSMALEADIRTQGGHYVEAPVSGSRKPAESGQLVIMLAGTPGPVASVRPLLEPMCRKSVDCGPTPNALLMQLAVNLFMICMVTGLAEAVHFAQRHGVELAKLLTVLDASPMASDVSRVKAAKLASYDFAAQATIPNVLESTTLIAEAARAAHIASPLLDVCHALYAEADALLDNDLDMIGVIRAIEKRTAAIGVQEAASAPDRCWL
jgi:3-hydroxyisobutyrate dehydrogenase